LTQWQEFDNYQTMKAETLTLLPGQFDLIAKALADPRRMAMLECIGEKTEECQCQSLLKRFSITKGTISHHMKELNRAGLITTHRDGQYISYEVRRDVLQAYTEELMRRVKIP
jgi:ArsR family transcriptional regulator